MPIDTPSGHPARSPVPIRRADRPCARRPPALPPLGRPALTTDALAGLASLYFSLVSCRPFWRASLDGQPWQQASTWGFAAAILVALVSLNLLALGLVLNRWTARPVLAILVIAGAVASFYVETYGTILDPGMLRNVLHTEVKEASDLIGWPLLRHLVVEAGPALAFLAWIRLAEVPPTRQLLRRAALVGIAATLLLTAVGLSFQALASLFRNHREARYLISPLNVVYSTARVLGAPMTVAAAERQAVGADVRLGAGWSLARRPVLLFVVVGETARAANWGLGGYRRQTTPELARLDVINYGRVTSCGSDTETSLPCLFSPQGRRDYDEKKIRSSESLLQVLARAGYAVSWRDNQTGCKGVCGGLPYTQVDLDQADCEPGQCPDDKLLVGLEDALRGAQDGNRLPGRVVVMHQIGNHGPAYFRRYPAAFRHFVPACETTDLRRCTVDEIVNAYDNALRYTDHVLAEAIRMLARLSDRYDTALVYVSDHGESLGENGLFLHGMPYAFAPAVQTRVPMVLWLSPSFQRATMLDPACLRAGADKPVSHDFVFSTILGLLDLDTSVRIPALDLTAPCRHVPIGPPDARKPIGPREALAFQASRHASALAEPWSIATLASHATAPRPLPVAARARATRSTVR